MLKKTRNTKFLQKINVDPVQKITCSVEQNEFANFLESIFDAPNCDEKFEYMNFASLANLDVFILKELKSTL